MTAELYFVLWCCRILISRVYRCPWVDWLCKFFCDKLLARTFNWRVDGLRSLVDGLATCCELWLRRNGRELRRVFALIIFIAASGRSYFIQSRRLLSCRFVSQRKIIVAHWPDIVSLALNFLPVFLVSIDITLFFTTLTWSFFYALVFFHQHSCVSFCSRFRKMFCTITKSSISLK